MWYALPYILYAVLCAIAAAASLGMIEPKIDSEKFSLRNYIKQMKEGTRHAFHNKRTTAISLYFVAVAGITWAVNLYFYDLALTQLIESDELRGIIGAGVRVVNVFILYMLLKQERIFTRQVSIWFFPAIMITGYFGSWYFFNQLTLAIFFIALTVMAGSARWIILTRYTNECFDSKYRATAISVLSMLVGIIYVVITGISGYVMDLFAGVPSMFLILGLLSVVFVLPLAQINSAYVAPVLEKTKK
jgi:MFS family permease